MDAGAPAIHRSSVPTGGQAGRGAAARPSSLPTTRRAETQGILGPVSSSNPPWDDIASLDNPVQHQLSRPLSIDQFQRDRERENAQMHQAIDEFKEKRARDQQEAKLREDRLAAIAEAAHRREEDADRRNKWLFWIAVAGLIFSIIAAVTGIIAIN